jgi:hypothetical protein
VLTEAQVTAGNGQSGGCSSMNARLSSVAGSPPQELSSAGKPDNHEYELYLAIENIDHTRTKARNPQMTGICERFHKTLLDEFYRIAFRKSFTAPLPSCRAD